MRSFTHPFRLRVVATATCVSLCVPARAAADAPRFVLHWEAPAGCPDEAAMQAEVLGRLEPGAALRADGVVTTTEAGFRLVLHVHNQGSIGERELSAASCAELARSAAIILALSVPRAAPAVAPSPSPAPEGPAPDDVAPAAHASPRPSRVRLTPALAFDAGSLPSAAPGAAIDAVVGLGDGLAVGVRAAAWPRARYGVAGDEGADFSLLAADVDGCYALRQRSIELSPCAVVEVARASATAVGVSVPVAATATWLAVGAGVRARWELHAALAIALELDGLAPTRGQSFYVVLDPTAERQTVHSLGPVAVRGYLGPEVRF